MAFALDKFLYQQSIRLQREDWKQNAQLLGDEMFTILSSIQVAGPTIVVVDENGNPIDVPDVTEIPGIDIPPFDFPDNPQNPTQPVDPPVTEDAVDGEDGGDYGGPTSSRQTFWHRSSHPGKLTSDNSGSIFTCNLYVNGLNQAPKSITVTITDSTLAADVENGTWVTVFMIAQYEATSEVVDGQRLPSTLALLSLEYLFNAPGISQGGRIGVVTEEISAGSAGEPGSGTVLLKKYDEGSWVDDETAEVFSTVSSEVKVDKDVQMKRVSGELFVDVEDCGEAEEGVTG